MYKKVLKNFLGIAFLGIIFLNTNTVFASVDISKMKKTENENILYDIEEDEYYDLSKNGYIDKIYKVEDGMVVDEISVEEYLASELILEEETMNKPSTNMELNPLFKNRIITPYNTYYYAYRESSNTKIKRTGGRASIIQRNYGPGSDTLSIAYSYTEGMSWNATLSSEKFNVIKGSVSYTFTSTATISSSSMMTIAEGYMGWWHFEPYVRKTQGTLYRYFDYYLVDSESITGYYPAKMGNALDGVLTSIKAPLN